ncbi:MAG: hypothetical protein UR66_C0002G0113 [Candidatus Moranbacteria bacterium GW2011_GWE1_35_17]|nr:MAG: hypothetical protein UR65_C0057G0002 [Candidatus Moranbacteria bacterium GW2011_GWE2_35_164]KKP69056.1 MAG: hypothetical protein UR66_C0002G0113 [Candidatus Moranbacteria bacterium GW2011_GWE1_35_17]KKP84507.1 MAG: hypothetical protein UR82_C0004G0023 [Candidatus Moranbacteria bacterium GW2011_GWF1_35_5]KKP84807.1 MAG: hypothetical protein UR83_C0011G0007 [Candidatus Moranbacteria bacterium GW2011_GWF2_35_54]
MEKTFGANGILLVIGIVLGFWGSMILNFAWFVAPFIGFILMGITDGMSERYRFFVYSKWIIALIVSAGIILGGLPLWGIITGIWFATVEKFSWLPILQIFVTAILFFCGCMSHELYYWWQERKAASKIG